MFGVKISLSWSRLSLQTRFSATLSWSQRPPLKNVSRQLFLRRGVEGGQQSENRILLNTVCFLIAACPVPVPSASNTATDCSCGSSPCIRYNSNPVSVTLYDDKPWHVNSEVYSWRCFLSRHSCVCCMCKRKCVCEHSTFCTVPHQTLNVRPRISLGTSVFSDVTALFCLEVV